MKKVYGLTPKNKPQEDALIALTDPEISLVVLEGCAGSGKTLLALAAGLQQVFDIKLYNDIIFTRAPIGVGEDIGFLPGTEQEKMAPWCGALMDNLEFLHGNERGKFAKDVMQDIIGQRVKVLAMLFMRGRSFMNRYVIIDESQNLTAQQVKVLITRAGEGTKIVLMGDTSQIDNKKVNTETNGLSHIINSICDVPFIKYVKLEAGERSQLSNWAAEVL